jgi:pyridoxal phosphate enzyme (YggS family)
VIKDNLFQINERIRRSALDYDRDPETVKLVCVSKTIPFHGVKDAIDAGATLFGENYIQEARDKIASLESESVSWHFIGHLQSNKAKYAVKLFDLIHSVDSFKLAREIDKQARKNRKIQSVLIQVNIAEEVSKSGISEEDAPHLIRQISHLKNVSIRGLMTMPPFFNAPAKVKPYFKALRHLRDRIEDMQIDNTSMAELSMGMTGDFEAAIEEGATLVRIGTAIFGERQ